MCCSAEHCGGLRMTGLGDELPLKSCVRTANFEEGDAESGARPDLTPSITPELAGLIASWANLPEPVRLGILAMVEAAQSAGE